MSQLPAPDITVVCDKHPESVVVAMFARADVWHQVVRRRNQDYDFGDSEQHQGHGVLRYRLECRECGRKGSVTLKAETLRPVLERLHTNGVATISLAALPGILQA